MEEANKFKSSLNFNNEEEGNQKMKHFVDYIRLKRIEKILEEKQKIIDKKKLILIWANDQIKFDNLTIFYNFLYLIYIYNSKIV